MAWRAGAPIANMEFIQFHPTCLYHPEARSFLITEAVRGEGGRARRRKDGASSWSATIRAERSRRATSWPAPSTREMKRTGAPLRLPRHHATSRAEFVRERFPNIYETCLALGIDITKEPIPVVPAAHYQCGGVLTDVNGATSLRGLYAVGEVACTGLHGANRLASNSLLEARRRRASRRCEHILCTAAASDSRRTRPIELPEWQSGDAQDVDELVVIYHNWDEIRRLMWDYVGIVRTNKRLQRAATRLRNLQARDPGVLLELQRHRRPAGTAQPRHRPPRSSWTAPCAGTKAAGCTTRLDYPGDRPALPTRYHQAPDNMKALRFQLRPRGLAGIVGRPKQHWYENRYRYNQLVAFVTAILKASEAQSPISSSTDFQKAAMRLRENALLKLEPQVVAGTNFRSGFNRYPWKRGHRDNSFLGSGSGRQQTTPFPIIRAHGINAGRRIMGAWIIRIRRFGETSFLPSSFRGRTHSILRFPTMM